VQKMYSREGNPGREGEVREDSESGCEKAGKIS
jgi:hypothetical protein